MEESGPVLALLLTFVVHVVGMVVLVATMGRDVIDVFRTKPRRRDDDGGPPPEEPLVPAPEGGGGGLPLPDAEQAPVRLREPGRIADRYERPARRRDREPVPAPERETA